MTPTLYFSEICEVTLTTNLIIVNYLLISTTSFIFFITLKNHNLSNMNISKSNNFSITLFTVLFFLNLAGVPPLPGFFIKINFIFSLIKNFNFIITIIITILNFTIFYLYIQFYKNTYTYTKYRSGQTSLSAVWVSNISALLILNFYPIYSIMTLIL